MFAGLADPRGYRFLPGDPPTSVEALRLVYDRQLVGRSRDGTETWLNWVVRGPPLHAPLGYTQATIRDRVATVAYHVFPVHWRRGIGTAALGGTLDQLFTTGLAGEVRACVDTRNDASIALLRKLGFRWRRTILRADHFKGSRSDEFEFALPRETWPLVDPPRG